jgi:RNA-binding protein YlmH
MTWKKVMLEGDVAVLSDNAPENVDFNVASAGVAVDASRRDHKHDVPEAVVGDLAAVDGQVASIGTANKFVRADHRHALGPLQSNLDCNQKQLVGQVMHVAAAAPNSGAEVEGQIYYNSTGGDKHPYIWVP